MDFLTDTIIMQLGLGGLLAVVIVWLFICLIDKQAKTKHAEIGMRNEFILKLIRTLRGDSEEPRKPTKKLTKENSVKYQESLLAVDVSPENRENYIKETQACADKYNVHEVFQSASERKEAHEEEHINESP